MNIYSTTLNEISGISLALDPIRIIASIIGFLLLISIVVFAIYCQNQLKQMIDNNNYLDIRISISIELVIIVSAIIIYLTYDNMSFLILLAQVLIPVIQLIIFKFVAHNKIIMTIIHICSIIILLASIFLQYYTSNIKFENLISIKYQPLTGENIILTLTFISFIPAFTVAIFILSCRENQYTKNSIFFIPLIIFSLYNSMLFLSYYSKDFIISTLLIMNIISILCVSLIAYILSKFLRNDNTKLWYNIEKSDKPWILVILLILLIIHHIACNIIINNTKYDINNIEKNESIKEDKTINIEEDTTKIKNDSEIGGDSYKITESEKITDNKEENNIILNDSQSNTTEQMTITDLIKIDDKTIPESIIINNKSISDPINVGNNTVSDLIKIDNKTIHESTKTTESETIKDKSDNHKEENNILSHDTKDSKTKPINHDNKAISDLIKIDDKTIHESTKTTESETIKDKSDNHKEENNILLHDTKDNKTKPINQDNKAIADLINIDNKIIHESTKDK